MESSETYSNPLASRYASDEMSRIFSDRMKFTTWRRLWIELARAEKELGLPVTDEQIAEMEAHVDDLDLDKAKEYEKKFRHDVMAHIHAFGDICPTARPIIHLGATSAYVGDNTDLIQMRDALALIQRDLVQLMRNLKGFAVAQRGLPTLGFTHFQPAQLTTVGKRACLWLQDFMMDYQEILHASGVIRFRGVKGTTGTQASFLSLFDGDHKKVRILDDKVSLAFGFERPFIVTGQTYTRKVDARVAAVLSSVAQSLTKFSNDLRLLAHLKEVEEPFEQTQVGSSAMPYKRNPMRAERIAAISRFVMSLESSPAVTAATQWFERTLDDSANKRLSIPQMFLGVDAALRIAINVSAGLVVNPAIIRKHIDAELPFIASEDILMRAVKKGGDRQELHEELRRLSHAAGIRVKSEGADNDLIERIRSSKSFGLSGDDLADVLRPELYVGRAPEQVLDFIAEEIDPILAAERDCPEVVVEMNV